MCLASLGYVGADRYRDVLAVTDIDLMTAGSTAPVESVSRLDVYEPTVLSSDEVLRATRPAGFCEFMAI